jgi:hypothetical protein
MQKARANIKIQRTGLMIPREFTVILPAADLERSKNLTSVLCTYNGTWKKLNRPLLKIHGEKLTHSPV